MNPEAETREDDDVRRLDLETHDPEVAERSLAESLPGQRIHAETEGGRFRFTHTRVHDGRLSISRMAFVGSIRTEGVFPNVVSVGQVCSGRFALDYAGEIIDTRRPFLRPAGESRASFDDAEIELITVDANAFLIAARAQLRGTGRLVRLPSIARAKPVSAAAATHWSVAAREIAAIANDPESFASPLVRSSVFELTVSTMLAVFPLTAEAGAASGEDAQPRAIRRAVQFIEEHAAEPITLAQIAAAARLSVRGLQYGFRRHLDETPTRFVRHVRLHGARDALLRADRTRGATVGEIARRWGFPQQARFAREYFAVFGELPSETLRR